MHIYCIDTGGVVYCPHTMRKRERHNALLELIANEPIGNQSLLASRLSTAGFTVTQTSVSRDLVELGIVKANGAYSLPRRKAEPVSDLGGVTFDTAGECLIVGRCASGLASAITVRIDADEIGEIVGTIAGDDTIFIAVKNADDQSVVLRILGEKFGQNGASI